MKTNIMLMKMVCLLMWTMLLINSFYGPKIPRSKKTLKKDGVVVDTNFLAWLDTMRDFNANNDEEWEWDGEGWQSGFDEHYSYNLGNRSEDSVIGGVISSIIPEPRRVFDQF